MLHHSYLQDKDVASSARAVPSEGARVADDNTKKASPEVPDNDEVVSC